MKSGAPVNDLVVQDIRALLATFDAFDRRLAELSQSNPDLASVLGEFRDRLPNRDRIEYVIFCLTHGSKPGV